MAYLGIVAGYSEHVFGPNDKVTREQLGEIIYRYAKYKGYDTSFTNDLSTFSDSGKVSSWALEGMKWAVSKGIINGVTATSLDPGGYTTRAQLATIIKRMRESF
jgi:hypothetical protein